MLMNSFLTSQFNYCLLTWMCHCRTMNNKINRLHERCLHIVHSDKTSSFEKLLEKDGSVTIHTRNLQTLATEMFKVYKNLSPAIIADLFHVRQNNYNLRHDSYFAIPNVKSVYYGTERLSNLGPRIWNLVPHKLKQLLDIHAFKKENKKWKSENCPFRLCKTKLIYRMSVLFLFASLYLLLKAHSRAVHQKLSYEGSFLRENALTWSSSSAFTAYFLSAFSIGLFKIYFLFMHVYVDFKIFISVIFKC